ncbi:hypothetical protein [Stappia stellulata]|uniref:hypothetical protein n=1 Tax=Stappia stellulata TaxID=71235 RepID=UPI0004095E25|nr:hypothetical protein [Stappia stellulata]
MEQTDMDWLREHRENVRDVILRCLAAGLEGIKPGVTTAAREVAERALFDWPEGTPPYVRAFADEETRRLIALILPSGEARPEPPVGPRAPHRGRRP